MNQIIRFALFAAIVVAVIAGTHANRLQGQLETQKAAAAMAIAERDSWKAKFEKSQTDVGKNTTSLNEVRERVKQLEAELEQAKQPSVRAPRR